MKTDGSEIWAGNEALDKLRSRAAASSTGTIRISIEELNEVLPIKAALSPPTGKVPVDNTRLKLLEAVVRGISRVLGRREKPGIDPWSILTAIWADINLTLSPHEFPQHLCIVPVEKLREIQYQPNGPSEDMLCLGCFAMKDVDQCTADCWLAALLKD